MILVVEDHRTLRLMIIKGLKKQGYEVEEASNGKEGLEIIEKKEPELIISDVKMPEMDGFEFLQKVRENNKIIPFIFLTVLDDIEDYEKGYKLGADSYITKPFEIDHLLERVKTKLKKGKILKDICDGKINEIRLEDISITELIDISYVMEKRIKIETEQGEGEIIIRDGEIKEARFDDKKGKDAIPQIIGLRSGKLKIL